jgi:outer membrane protein assembly factor BamD
MRLRILFIALFFALALPTTVSAQEGDSATYQAQAQQSFLEGEQALEDDDFIEAQRLYTFVRNRFPYSQYAALADLRLGDVYYRQDKFAAAIEQYRGFIKLHPRHPEIPYAAFQVAMSFYGQMPEDWWFMPPAYEKDLSPVLDARREFEYFLKRYKNSEFEKKARRRLAQIRRRLADHEFYVANFYLEGGNYRAAAMRYRYLLENYSGVGLDDRALFLLARSYLELKDVKAAKRALDDLVEFHPDSSLADDAREYLATYRLE